MNKESSYQLPKNWTWTTLGELGIVVSGGTPSTNEPLFWGNDIPWITPADLSGYQDKYISRGRRDLSLLGYNNSSAILLPKGSLLFSSRAPIGYIAIAQNDLTTNQGFKNLIPVSSTYIDYLYYYLISAEQEIVKKARGTTFLELSGSAFGSIPVPLAPIDEQHRIVSKLDELLSDLEKGKEQLYTSLRLLEIYKQSFLQKAFDEGKNEIVSTKNKKWKFKTLEQISSILGDGLHGTPSYSERGDYYFINGNNLSDGKIKIKEKTKKVSFNEYEKYKKPLNENTILVSINGTLGKTAFYNNEKVVLGKSACYFNLKEGINKQYVRYYLISNNFTMYANKQSTGSVIKNLGLRAMRDFPIPLPPNKDDQDKIVLEIDRQFSICDALEETLKSNLHASEVLKKTLLANAFEGKLTNQDSQETSAILLECIKKEIDEYFVEEKAKKIINNTHRINKIRMAEELKTIIDLLTESKEPISTKYLWQSSINKDNIDEFYAELKHHIEKGEIIEVRKGKESFLQLSTKS